MNVAHARRLLAIVDGLAAEDRDLLLAALDPRLARCIRLAARDRVLIEAAERFFANPNRSEQARQLAQALDRYFTSAWRHDRAQARCPYPCETLRALFWHLLTLAGGRPIGRDRIRAVLIAEYRFFQSADRMTIE